MKVELQMGFQHYHAHKLESKTAGEGRVRVLRKSNFQESPSYLSCPAVSQICSLIFFPPSEILKKQSNGRSYETESLDVLKGIGNRIASDRKNRRHGIGKFSAFWVQIFSETGGRDFMEEILRLVNFGWSRFVP